MPEFMICDRDTPPKYAHVDGKRVVWKEKEEATIYPTAEAARDSFNAVCSAMLVAAKAKLAKGIAEGKVTENPKPSWRNKKYLYGAKSAGQAIHLFAPMWLADRWGVDGYDSRRDYPVASRPTNDDLLGVFETFHVRLGQFWLSRGQQRGAGASYSWDASFSAAVPFSSHEAARETALQMGNSDAWIVKSSCVFTEVQPVTSSGITRADPVIRSISAACEARDIRASLDESVKARSAAMQATEDAPSTPKRQRL